MDQVERLLGEYKQAHRAAPDADPRPFLAQVSGAQRELLAGLIDVYLEQAPRRRFDPAALGASEALVDQLERSLGGASGMWPALLPRLRSQARLRRAELVGELAARLGAGAQQDKVAAYYHQMEQGLLPAVGVSDTVLEALGKIVGWSSAALRRAGELPAPGPPRADPGAVFARSTRATPGEPPPAAPAEWDEVDRLFRGAPPG